MLVMLKSALDRFYQGTQNACAIERSAESVQADGNSTPAHNLAPAQL